MTTGQRTRPAPGMLAALLIVLGLLLVLVVLAVSGADVGGAVRRAVESMFPPVAATTQAREIRGLYDIVFWIAAVIFLVVEGLIIWSVVRYRRKPDDFELPPQTHGNNTAEIAWTVIPTIIVAFLFYVSWQTLNSVDTVSARPDIHVKAIARQFQWSFVYYAEDGVTEQFTQIIPSGEGGGMAVPVGRTVQLTLESPDVIHAFYVPHFLFKRDVVPGQVNKFDFRIEPEFAGQTFHGQCAELCGIGHRVMEFQVKAMTQADFQAWFDDMAAKASASPSPGASGGPAPPPAAILNIAAQNIQFDVTALEAPADKPFDIVFENRDNGIPHDVAIRDSGNAIVFNGDDQTSAGKATYHVAPLAAASYTFFCTFHANMSGTLTVK